MKTKQCRDCRLFKEFEQFIKNKAFSSGYDTLCKNCNRKRVQEWRKNNPEKRAKQQQREATKDYTRNKFLKYYYGITLEKYNEMFKNQNGCCAICKKHQVELNKRLFVDHCHNTGKIRKLLCQKCNTLLGMAEENPDVLKEAINYLNTGY